MHRILRFTKCIIAFFSLIILSNGQRCPCSPSGNSLFCLIDNTTQVLNVDLCNPTTDQTVNILYRDNAALNLMSLSPIPIYMDPVDANNSHQLKIASINTNAVKIEIRIQYSSVSVPLFQMNSTIMAPNASLTIMVTQVMSNSTNFQLFDSSNSTRMNFTSFELSFSSNSTGSGTLNLHNLVRGFMNIQSIAITGINHSLTIDNGQMPLMNKVNKLSLKQLFLYDSILDQFNSLKEYNIEQCSYTKTAKFLVSNTVYNISLTMKNNYPLDGILPNSSQAFSQLRNINDLTLIEPRLNSSVVRAIRSQTKPRNLFLQLGSYYQNDFDIWSKDRPIVWYLTIQNISNLNIFPSKFFNTIDSLQRVTLQGTFTLETQNICPFVGIPLQPEPVPPFVELRSPNIRWDTAQICARTYIVAINTRTMANIECPLHNTCDDCQRWAIVAEKCELIANEANCSGKTITNANPFSYNGSHLYNFFRNRSWLQRSNSTTETPKDDSVNIGAIIGAICALLIAIIVLGFTIFCICRRRKQYLATAWSKQEEKYIPSSDDSKHVSIATSKTSQSSRYALEKSFFPPMQPNDEIAPPLYTAPSESVKSAAHYNAPSAPPAYRESVSTRATHIYETLDS